MQSMITITIITILFFGEEPLLWLFSSRAVILSVLSIYNTSLCTSSLLAG